MVNLSSIKSYKILSEAILEAIKMNEDGKYNVICIFDVNSKLFYNLYSKEYDNKRKELNIKNFIIKLILKGKEEEKIELTKEDVFEEGKKFFEQSENNDITVEDFRNLLINNKRIRKEYETLKLELAQNEWAKTDDYASAKTDFIKEVIKKNRN